MTNQQILAVLTVILNVGNPTFRVSGNFRYYEGNNEVISVTLRAYVSPYTGEESFTIRVAGMTSNLLGTEQSFDVFTKYAKAMRL